MFYLYYFFVLVWWFLLFWFLVFVSLKFAFVLALFFDDFWNRTKFENNNVRNFYLYTFCRRADVHEICELDWKFCGLLIFNDIFFEFNQYFEIIVF
jgi:hypothetical protein